MSRLLTGRTFDIRAPNSDSGSVTFDREYESGRRVALEMPVEGVVAALVMLAVVVRIKGSDGTMAKKETI